MRILQSLFKKRQRKPKARQHFQAAQSQQLHAQLQHASHHHAHAQRINRLNAPAGKQRRTNPGCGNHRQIQKHGRNGRHSKMPPSIEHARGQCRHRHKPDVGENPARHAHCRLIPRWVAIKPAGHHPHQPGRKHHANRTKHNQHPKQHRRYIVEHAVRGCIALFLAHRSQHRHKSLAKRPFGKQAAKQVRNTKRHVKRIGVHARAKQRSHQQFTHQPQHARSQRQGRNNRSRFKKTHNTRPQKNKAAQTSRPVV